MRHTLSRRCHLDNSRGAARTMLVLRQPCSRFSRKASIMSENRQWDSFLDLRDKNLCGLFLPGLSCLIRGHDWLLFNLSVGRELIGRRKCLHCGIGECMKVRTLIWGRPKVGKVCNYCIRWFGHDPIYSTRDQAELSPFCSDGCCELASAENRWWPSSLQQIADWYTGLDK